MACGVAADERFADLVHFDSALHAGVDPDFFERVLKRQGVEHSGEHAHVIAGRTIDFETLLARAAENIAAAYHNGNLHAELVDVAKFFGDFVDGLAVNAETLRPLERFTRNFEKNAMVGGAFFAVFVVFAVLCGHSCFVRSAAKRWNCNKQQPGWPTVASTEQFVWRCFDCKSGDESRAPKENAPEFNRGAFPLSGIAERFLTSSLRSE